LKQVGINNHERVEKVVEMIVKKAQMEEHMSATYAQLCKVLSNDWITKTDGGEDYDASKEFKNALLIR